jgi:uncharacterized cupin superfamily protein
VDILLDFGCFFYLEFIFMVDFWAQLKSAHPSSQLFFHVLQGGGTFISDGKQTEIREGNIIHVLGTEKIGFVNANEDTTIYVIRCLKEE